MLSDQTIILQILLNQQAIMGFLVSEGENNPVIRENSIELMKMAYLESDRILQNAFPHYLGAKST